MMGLSGLQTSAAGTAASYSDVCRTATIGAPMPLAIPTCIDVKANGAKKTNANAHQLNAGCPSSASRLKIQCFRIATNHAFRVLRTRPAIGPKLLIMSRPKENELPGTPSSDRQQRSGMAAIVPGNSAADLASALQARGGSNVSGVLRIVWWLCSACVSRPPKDCVPGQAAFIIKLLYCNKHCAQAGFICETWAGAFHLDGSRSGSRGIGRFFKQFPSWAAAAVNARVGALRDETARVAHEVGDARVRRRLADHLAEAVAHTGRDQGARIGVGGDAVLAVPRHRDDCTLRVGLADQPVEGVDCKRLRWLPRTLGRILASHGATEGGYVYVSSLTTPGFRD